MAKRELLPPGDHPGTQQPITRSSGILKQYLLKRKSYRGAPQPSELTAIKPIAPALFLLPKLTFVHIQIPSDSASTDSSLRLTRMLHELRI